MNNQARRPSLAKSVELAVQRSKQHSSILRVTEVANEILRAHECQNSMRPLIVDALCARAIRAGMVIEFERA